MVFRINYDYGMSTLQCPSTTTNIGYIPICSKHFAIYFSFSLIICYFHLISHDLSCEMYDL